VEGGERLTGCDAGRAYCFKKKNSWGGGMGESMKAEPELYDTPKEVKTVRLGFLSREGKLLLSTPSDKDKGATPTIQNRET